MVVFINGESIKKDYRKFKIRTINTPNDTAMIKEVIERRFTNITDDQSFKSVPNLIVIDGGKNQLNATFSILKKLNKDIPVVGLAKKREEIFKIGNKDPLIIDRFNTSHLLIRRIRDEAHRFAISYHRTLRDKDLI